MESYGSEVFIGIIPGMSNHSLPRLLLAFPLMHEDRGLTLNAQNTQLFENPREISSALPDC
jgi:hypothetical protein